MKPFVISLLLALALTDCKSGGKKDPKLAMDDTARMNPVHVAGLFNPVRGKVSDLPSSLHLRGEPREIWTWKDARGENLLVTTAVSAFDDPEKDAFGEAGQTAEIHAWLFVKSDTGYKQFWTKVEKEKACPFDITCSFTRGGVIVTDLDEDHLAEVTLVYRLACRSDVSPALMNVWVREGDEQHVLEGLTWIQGGPDEKFAVTETDACLENLPGYTGGEADMHMTFGRYKTEKDFRGAPIEFLQHARKQWMIHARETFE